MGYLEKVITMQHKSLYPSTFYRVSIKAIIKDKRGYVLAVKEKGSSWNLPGGGIDHGETAERSLSRELYEEALISEPFTAQLVGTEIMWLESRQAYLLWLVYELKFDSTPSWGKGADADEVCFIDPYALQDGASRSEQLIYKWCIDRTHKVADTIH
jgi:8-oxo-dGTP pyrophosphatase MutT (NUDIX family)